MIEGFVNAAQEAVVTIPLLGRQGSLGKSTPW